MTIVITRGSHSLNTAVTVDETAPPRHFAHVWDYDDAEDTAHQAAHFIRYAQTLGNFTGPVELISTNIPDDPTLRSWADTQMANWASIVRSGLGINVRIR